MVPIIVELLEDVQFLYDCVVSNPPSYLKLLEVCAWSNKRPL